MKNNEQNEEFPERNGRKIVKQIIKRRSYQSITGAWMYIDKDGNVEGNYTVLQGWPTWAANPENMKVKRNTHYKNDQSHLVTFNEVGEFLYKNSENVTFEPNSLIRWVASGPPTDEPSCGFDNKQCEVQNRMAHILFMLLFGFFLVFAMGSFLLYHKWEFEQEVSGLLWILNSEDITLDEERVRMLFASRASLVSNSSLTQAKINDFSPCKLATYKGAVVCMKEFWFNKQRRSSEHKPFDSFTRQTKLELKLIKNMHHKNINPFIGACTLEKYPSSFFIVSEYCAKNSLRDIVENLELRLDQDFLCNLIHDILSGKFCDDN